MMGPRKKDVDDPFCPSLNTDYKQLAKANLLAKIQFDVTPKKARVVPHKDPETRTIFVSLDDSHEIIIQFQKVHMEIRPFEIARNVFAMGTSSIGVPFIGALDDEELEREGVWAYWLSVVPGRTWGEALKDGKGDKRPNVCRDLGKIMAKGWVEEIGHEKFVYEPPSCDDVIDNMIIPHLEALLDSDDAKAFHGQIRECVNQVDDLRMLPLFMTHHNLDETNLMVNDKCNISGMVDWQLSGERPFGMGLSRIHLFAGEFKVGKFWMPKNFEACERIFFDELLGRLPKEVRDEIAENFEAVNLSVLIGSIMAAFPVQDEEAPQPHRARYLRALPQWLTYRIPPLRKKDEPPFAMSAKEAKEAAQHNKNG